MKARKEFFIFGLLVAAAGGAIAYLAFENYFLRQNKSALEGEIAKITADSIAMSERLNNDISNLNRDVETLGAALDLTKVELASTAAARDYIGMQYNAEKERVDALNSQVSDIQGTVTTLEKIKQTDPELLKKYSKVYFLNENYVPQSLAGIDADFTFNTLEDYRVSSKVLPFLNVLLSTAKSEGIDLKVISAYRSFGEQSALKSAYKMTYGTGANKFSADQGYSEHQLGTTVDFTTKESGASFTGFEKSPAYEWLKANAYTFGFILSYPNGNKYYQYEPWHWRFVGRELAGKLYAGGRNFYDMDQREIDEYRASFFD